MLGVDLSKAMIEPQTHLLGWQRREALFPPVAPSVGNGLILALSYVMQPMTASVNW